MAPQIASHTSCSNGVWRARTFVVLWSLFGGCATYENALPGANGDPGGAGTDSGGTAADVGAGGDGSAGSSASGGTAGVVDGLAGQGGASVGVGGTLPSQAGGGVGGTSDSEAGGGTGGASLGGAAGASGSGGKGGSAGNGGSAGGGGKGNGGSAGSAGNGGSGGSTPVQTCAKNPIPARSAWVVTASRSANNGPPSNAHDGDVATRWTTGADQVGGEWLQIDFGKAVTLTRLTLMLGTSADDYPRSYATRFSNSSGNMAAPVLVSGMGAKGVDTVLNFPVGTTGRYLLISQSGKVTGLWWSVAEIQPGCAD